MTDHINKIASKLSGRTAGTVEFIKDTGPLRRDLRIKDYEWKPEIRRNLAKILWATERSHGYAMAALRLFSRMPAYDFSPDGLLGGLGYIQSVKDMRVNLSQAVEVLSSLSDTIHDEMNASHWKRAEKDDGDTQKIVDDAAAIKSDPEAFVDSQYNEDVDGAGGIFSEYENPSAEGKNPSVLKKDSDEDSGWGSGETQLSSFNNNFDHVANFMFEPSMMPGPRVMHLGPGASNEEGGFYSDQFETPSDDPGLSGFYSDDYIYEGVDANGDGVTGYDDATRGTTISSRVAASDTYGWLPGANNDRLPPIYDRNYSDKDIMSMLEDTSPTPPKGMHDGIVRPRHDNIWDELLKDG